MIFSTTLVLVVVIVLLSIVAFIGFVALVMLLISYIGMWAWLAKWYRFDGVVPITTETHTFVSGFIGRSRYGGVLTVASLPEGLYLSVMPLFRPGHPPLLIPWGDVHVRGYRSMYTLRSSRFVVLQIGEQPNRLITVPSDVVQVP